MSASKTFRGECGKWHNGRTVLDCERCRQLADTPAKRLRDAERELSSWKTMSDEKIVFAFALVTADEAPALRAEMIEHYGILVARYTPHA